MHKGEELIDYIRSYEPELLRSIRHILRELILNRRDAAVFSHPLSFNKIIVASHGATDVRVHVWLPDHSEGCIPVSTVHSHTWDLKSVVIAGSLVNRNYTVNDRADGDHELFVVDYRTNESERKSTGRLVSVSTESEACYSEGDSYSLNAQTFHATEVNNTALTVTVVLAEKVGNEACVVLPKDRPRQLHFPIAAISPKLASKTLSMLVGALS